ncbi:MULTISPECIES: DUF1376 domain-containing protein [Giesbergeria]|uniref:DUF1376 domain-containing protein n=1 Tax=Giesbergeria sinuosa TaxID=80883 RepID=A0ABV9QDG5_9BURK
MSSTTTLAPLTPADCDLRDFPFMLLDVKRLRDSDMALTESPEACWAAVLLWCSAWHQVPAGSLPDDDRVLANLAGYGRVVREWRKHKAGALHGWVKCSDGRLYHKTVAEKANTAWESKLQQRWKTECARIKKHNERNKTAYPLPQYEEWLAAGRPMGHPIASDSPEPKTDVPSDNQDCPDAVPSDMASKGEREGEGYLNTNTNTQPAAAIDQPAREPQPGDAPDGGVGVVSISPIAADDADDDLGNIPPCSTTPKSQMASAVCLALKAEGMASTNPSHPDLRVLLDAGATVDSFVQAARDMRERGNLPSNAFAYVIGTVKGQMQRAAAMASAAVAGAGAGSKSPKTTTKFSEKRYVGGML